MHVLWNRLKYVLSPQFDIYRTVAEVVRGKVADIGFGTGFGTHLLAQNADEVHGYDVDEDALQFAKTVFPFKELKFHHGDISKGIVGKYDYVVMIDVIEHIKDDMTAIVNVRKMINKNGSFICSTPNRLSRYRKAETHVREYSPQELGSLLANVFPFVDIKNHRFEPIATDYEHPLLAVCRCS